MDCKECIWFKIYDFIFPDGTKTMTCEKYNKHLGFTNKRGQVEKFKRIDECRRNINAIRPTEGTEIVTNKEGICFDSESKKYKVKVNDGGIYCFIAATKTKERAEQILKMFKERKSFVKNIIWNKRKQRWVAREYDKNLKRYIHITQSKYFSETLKKLVDFKGGNLNVG
ncbi:MAG: hypothetical protein SPE36_02615 [Lactobacillus johnsonii]|nr:hypothetical protein [Lactobacillus johnsonii]